MCFAVQIAAEASICINPVMPLSIHRRKVSNFEQIWLRHPRYPGSLRSLRWSPPMFSHAIDIKRFQNLLDTSADDTERRRMQKLLTEDKTKAAVRESEPKKE